MKTLPVCLLGSFLLVFSGLWAEGEGAAKPIQFAKGKTGTALTGKIKGRENIDYQVRAGAGQTMIVELKAGSSAAYFNVLPPGTTGEAIFKGHMDGNTFKGELPADGVYTIRLYLMGAARDENKTVNYTLNVSIPAGGKSGSAATTGKGTSAAGESAKAEASQRAGEGKFDATGNVPCARYKGQPMGQCAFGVTRDGGGTAAVAVTRQDGRKRFIFFEKGKAVGADLSQADGNMNFRAVKKADLYLIEAGDERYEIPEAVVFGGGGGKGHEETGICCRGTDGRGNPVVRAGPRGLRGDP
jgi:hypothetical protein